MRDSFTSKQSQDLETMQAGEFTIWVHHGPQALLAGTILGTPPPELRNVFARENELHPSANSLRSSLPSTVTPARSMPPVPSARVPARPDQPAARGRAWWWLRSLGRAAFAHLLIAVGSPSSSQCRWENYLTRLND